MPEQPKPCPFPECGNSGDYLVVDQFVADVWYVGCENDACGMTGPSRPTKAEAIRAWNRIRVEPEEPHA